MRKDISKLTRYIAIAFVILTAAFGLYFYANPAEGQKIMEMYLPTVESIQNADGSISYLKMVLNNLFACATTMGMGLIPFLFLPLWAVISNAMMIGALLGLGAASGALDPWKTIVVGLLPHGIFELPAFFLSMAMGLYLCRFLSRKLLRRAGEEKILTVLNGEAKAFVLVVMPLIFIAAAIECTITPWLMGLSGLQ